MEEIQLIRTLCQESKKMTPQNKTARCETYLAAGWVGSI